MKVDDIIRETKRLADDDQSILTTDIQDWIDMCIGRINQACKCNIPTISSLPTSTIPSFDARYHEILVLFCVGKYREGDSDYTAAQYFMKEFQDMLSIMQRDMPINPSIQLGDSWLQLAATSDGQTIFSLVGMPYGSYFNNLVVYQNDVEITDYCTFDLRNKQMTIDTGNVTIKNADKISVNFLDDSETNNAPYEWWERAGW